MSLFQPSLRLIRILSEFSTQRVPFFLRNQVYFSNHCVTYFIAEVGETAETKQNKLVKEAGTKNKRPFLDLIRY